MARLTENLVPRLNVFISSPSDVKEERDIAEKVINRVADHPLIAPHFDLRALRWETRVPSAAMNPQDAVNYYIGQASEAQIVLCIFAGRMGTPYTHPKTGEVFDSGTQYEFVDAYRSSQRTGFPHVMLYRGLRDTGDHGKDQTQKLNAFFARIGTEFQIVTPTYNTLAEFEVVFERELLQVLGKWIQEQKYSEAGIHIRSKDEIVHDSSRINFQAMLPIFGRDETIQRIYKWFDENIIGVSIIGIGGIGKSRIAAEIATSGRFKDGIVWHEITPQSTVEDLTNLISDRISADRDLSADEIWKLLGKLDVLLVLDNAEDCTNVEFRKGYLQRLLNLGALGGSRCLITSRERWIELQGKPTFKVEELAAPSLQAAVQILLAMYEREQPAFALEGQEETFAQAAYLHPRIIEQSVCWLWNYPVSEIIEQLKNFRGDTQEILSDIVQRTLDLVRTQAHGGTAIDDLRKLCVFRGGFTADAAKAVLGSTDSLGLLRRYCLVGISNNRYDIHPIVLGSVKPDPAAQEPHYLYYRDLVDQKSNLQSYADIDIDAINVDIAFDHAVTHHDLDDVLAFYELCVPYLDNRVQLQRRLDWILRTVKRIEALPSSFSSAQIAKAYFLYAIAVNALSVSDRTGRRLQALDIFRTAERHISLESDPLFWVRFVSTRAEIERDAGSPTGDADTRRSLIEKILRDLEPIFSISPAGLSEVDQVELKRKSAYAYRITETLYRRLGNRTEASRAIEAATALYDELLNDYRRLGNEDSYRDIINILGIAFGRLSRNATDLETAKTYRLKSTRAYEEAASLAKNAGKPLTYAMYEANISAAYRALSEFQDHRQNLHLAIAHRAEALKFRTMSLSPSTFASSQTILGIYYRVLSETEDFESNIQRSLDACQRALQFRSPAIDPVAYASTQTSLGKTYTLKAERLENRDDLKLAIDAFKESIANRSQRSSNQGYAFTNGELGRAYSLYAELDVQNAAEHLATADRYFREALLYHDETQDPRDHATIFAGRAEWHRMAAHLSEAERTENLNKALELALRSLEIGQSKFYFATSAEAQEQIGWILRDMGRMDEAISRLREASETYRQMEMPHKSTRASALADQLAQSQ